MRSTLILMMASFMMLSACGQKGPLYLSEDQSSNQSSNQSNIEQTAQKQHKQQEKQEPTD